MTNPFYNASGNPGDRAPGSSQTMRAEFVSIQQGFDRLPTTLTPNTVVVVNPGGTALTTTAYALALGGALTLAGAFTTTGPYSTTLAQQANTTLTLPASNATLATLALAETLSNKTLTAPAINTPTVSGGTFTSPALVTPQLGTPASGNLANCTALPISTGVSGLAAGVATFLGAPSSANLLAAMTDETGTGPLVFGTSPTLNTPTISSATLTSPDLGTPSAGNLANCTNLPLTTGTSGVLPQAKGGTGSSFVPAQGAIFFQGPSSTFGSDSGNINWNNTDKTLGIGTTAPGGASWRTLIQSFGFGTYPLVMKAAVSGATIAYFGENATVGGGFMVLGDNSNTPKVQFQTNGLSYITGGAFGINTATPYSWLDVQGNSGVLTPAELARIGSSGYARFLRFGIRDATNNGSPINQAPFIQSNYNNDPNSNYMLMLNPNGSRVTIGGTRESAAALDVVGDVAVSDASFFFTPYNGGVNTGTIRAGIQVAGATQELNFYTGNAYRGTVLSNGNLYFGGKIGAGVIPGAAWTSFVQANGDLTLTPAVSTLFWNGFYDGAWKYANNGWPAALRTDGTGLLQLFGGAQNSGGAGAAWGTQVNVWSANLASGNMGIGGNPTGRRLSIFGNVNGEHASIVSNLNTGSNAYSIMYAELANVGNVYVGLSVGNNAGAPVARLAVGSAVTSGIVYDAANGRHAFYAGSNERLRIENTAITALGVPFNTTSTAGNFFANLVLQGVTGTGAFVRSNDNTNLFLGANGNNVVAVHNSGSYFYPLVDNAVQSGASGNRWAQEHSFSYYAWGATSGYTSIVAQAAALNNVVTLPPYTGTLLIGGTQVGADLGGDVALNNTSTYFNGPSIALPAGGTWFVTAGMTIQDYNSAANFEARLIQTGGTVIASALLSTWASGAGTTVVLSGFVSGGLTATAQAIGNSSVFGRILATTLGGGGGQPRASWIRAFRVA